MDKDLILAKARLKILEAEHPKSQEVSKKEPDDILMVRALDEVSKATSHIEPEKQKIKSAIERIKLTEPKEISDIKIPYLEHKMEVIAEQFTMYEEVCKQRKERYNSLMRSGRWNREKELCAEDTHHWFQWWAWTSDPRTVGFGWALPFIPYDFQKDAIDWLEEHIFITQTPCLIEKSRDLGFSWLIASLFYKHWQHADGTFQALVGSMTIDDVDMVGNASTLFEKLRIQGNMQPKGIIPVGWNREIPYLKCVNPETKASIIGESMNPRFGRSGRYKVILGDELSAVEQDTQALTACSQSSPCKIWNSTVRGMGNEFALLAHSNSVDKRTYHWTQHPYKDERWYEYQKLEMRDPTRVAQELDIDYTASTPNRVYADYDEVYHTVTQSEVMRALPQFKNPKSGKFWIPLGHSVAMGEDVSMAEGCAHVLEWIITLKEGTETVDGIDVSGNVLFYREMVMPPLSTPRKVANKLIDTETSFELRSMEYRLLSHEAKTEREIYEDEYGLVFEHWDTNFNTGIVRIRDYLEILNTNEPHPFRDYTRKDKFGEQAPPINGRPMMFIVSEDEQAELQMEGGKYKITPPKDDKGLHRLRSEFPLYHIPSKETGKEVLKQRPKKVFDDAMDVCKGLANKCFTVVRRLSVNERAVKSLPENLQGDRISQLPIQDMQVAYIQQRQHLDNYIKQESERYTSWRERVMGKAIKNSYE